MTIYQIIGDIRSLNELVESLTDEETGETRELSDEEKKTFLDWINEQEEAFNSKFDNTCKVYRNLQATADICTAEKDTLKAEYDRLSKRAKARQAEADRVKGLIWFALDALGMQKKKTALFSAGIQNTAASVRVGDSIHPESEIANLIPEEFIKKEVAKSKIVEQIKAGRLYQKPVSVNGEEVKAGTHVFPLDDGAVFGKTAEGLEYRLEGIKYLQGKTCVIR
jgi:hypothetical protein